MTEDAHPDDPRKDWIFKDELTWFHKILSPNYARYQRGDTRVWCPLWHQHPEVRMRVTAMWTSWEALTPDDIGQSTWWIHHCDPHMNVLLDPHGPMQGCTWDEHNPDQVRPLPHTARVL